MHWSIFILTLCAALGPGFLPDNDPNLGGLMPVDHSIEDRCSDEYIPVKPNPLRRLQANYETSKLEPGVSVIDECGCPGCCTLKPVTVTETILLTSTNYCFFTATAVTTTEITQFTTETTTRMITKTSNLKIVETVTRQTTQTILSQVLTTTTITNTVKRFQTEVRLATESTLSVQTSLSFIEGTVTRQVPFFTPYTIFTGTSSSFLTFFEQDFTVTTLQVTITDFGGGTSRGPLELTSTNTVTTSVNGPLITTVIVQTQTLSLDFAIQALGTATPSPLSTIPFSDIISSTNFIQVPFTATIPQITQSGVAITVTEATTVTFSFISTQLP